MYDTVAYVFGYTEYPQTIESEWVWYPHAIGYPNEKVSAYNSIRTKRYPHEIGIRT